MNDPKHSAQATGSATAGEAELGVRLERLRALRSAGGALASSGIDAKPGIHEAVRALAEDLERLQNPAASAAERVALPDIDARLDDVERELQEFTVEARLAPGSNLREVAAADRRGLLDLLDLVLGAEVAGLEGTAARIPTLDYLISLLCADGDGNATLHDPVTLTSRLYSLCERSDVDSDPRLPELEAEFYAASDVHRPDVRGEIDLQALSRLKLELGSAFFAPRVLRAIVTYNARLLRLIDEGVLSAKDWAKSPSAEGPGEVSVFETTALPRLAGALRRRAAGEAQANEPLDRIAWCLDLGLLTGPEREALLAESAGQREELLGTTVLVGLLCRSAVVLEEEFPAVGIDPKRLSGAWIAQLDEALQQEVNGRIASQDYQGACALSELKGKFLTEARTDVQRRSRAPRPALPRAPVHDDVEEDVREQANQIARSAVATTRATRGSPRRLWGRIARGAAGVLAVLVAVALVNAVFFDAGRTAGAQLAGLSPYLSSGKRSGEGNGPGFVGRLGDAWSELDSGKQRIEARVLVKALRARGIREIMLYDDDGRLRIQALGSQPLRIDPAPIGR